MLEKADCAILVVDMLNDFVLPDSPLRVEGAYATLPAIRKFLDYGRRNNWAIIYVNRSHRASGVDAEMTRRHFFEEGHLFCVPGTKGAEVVETIKPHADDILVTKHRFSAFFATDLDIVLRGLGVKTVYVTGTQYPNCIRATAVDSMGLDYLTIVCTDCCSAATPQVAETNIADIRNMGIQCVPSTQIMK